MTFKIDVDAILEDKSYLSEPVHDSLSVAERTCQTTLAQFVKINLLRLEGALYIRDALINHGNVFYTKSKNDFNCWMYHQHSQATNHAMNFTGCSGNNLNLFNFFKIREIDFF